MAGESGHSGAAAVGVGRGKMSGATEPRARSPARRRGREERRGGGVELRLEHRGRPTVDRGESHGTVIKDVRWHCCKQIRGHHTLSAS